MKKQSYSKGIQEKFSGSLNVLTSKPFQEQLKELFKIKRNPEAAVKAILFIIGALFTAISFCGMLLGYRHSYQRFMQPKEELPRLSDLPLIVKVAMALGIAVTWTLVFVAMYIWIALEEMEPGTAYVTSVFLGTNIVMSLIAYFIFRRWRNGIWNLLMDKDANGTARFANEDDLKNYKGGNGLYIGDGYTFSDKGHMLLVSGTRGGKSQNMLTANVLRVCNYQGSMVVIDPKGEIAAVCARRLRDMGKRVITLNPFGLLEGLPGPSVNYNPLDFISDKSSEHLLDDVVLISELIVPIKENDHNPFFTNSGRNLIAALLLHLVTTDKVEKPHLGILWQWLRLHGKEWDQLLADMYESTDPINGNVIRMAASEIAKMMESQETFSSIISHSLEDTSFLKSHLLQGALQSGGFDPYSLTDGNTVVFIVLPFDKLRIYSNYLRLVVATLMRAIVRKPSKENRTTFLVDEAYNLSYLREFETCLSGYAGFNISLWLVYQDLNQIRSTYGNNWESVMANCTIRQFMTVRDNFSLKYISAMLGDKTRVMYKQNVWGTIVDVQTSHRPLATPNEVMRLSQNNMLLFAGENPAAILPKIPYYEMPELKDVNGNNLYDPNPYIDNSK